MLTEQLFQPFEITIKKSNECPVESHRHTFFELIYILQGTGTHLINRNKFDYAAENLFLIMPEVPHHFKIKQTTTFLLIRFNNIYLKAQKAKEAHSDLGDWIQKLEYVFHNNNSQLGCIIRNKGDRPLVKTLAESIIQEYVNQNHLHKELVQQLVNTIITVVARNIALHLPEVKKVQDNLSQKMIYYVQQHIYHLEKLKVEAIASTFNISPNYVSEYFKKHTGETLQQYIINYKLKLAEVRLQYSDMRVNEIAFELGFTDESHLTKMFRKYNGQTPSIYRRSKTLVKD
jgi:AraC-like DNA-binding protein